MDEDTLRAKVRELVTRLRDEGNFCPLCLEDFDEGEHADNCVVGELLEELQ